MKFWRVLPAATQRWVLHCNDHFGQVTYTRICQKGIGNGIAKMSHVYSS